MAGTRPRSARAARSPQPRGRITPWRRRQTSTTAGPRRSFRRIRSRVPRGSSACRRPPCASGPRATVRARRSSSRPSARPSPSRSRTLSRPSCSLGRGLVVEALRAAKLDVHAHDDHFAQNTPDAEWLVEVGRRGWVVLTKDKNIRVNALERLALVRANVACIMLGRGDLTASAMAQV
jgi:hypothetical protein